MTPAEMLHDLAQLYQERNKQYGQSYTDHGYLMKIFFPNGVTLNNPADYNRFIIFEQIVIKLYRYAHNFTNGGHRDSTKDISVYSQMLEYLDYMKEGIELKINDVEIEEFKKRWDPQDIGHSPAYLCTRCGMKQGHLPNCPNAPGWKPYEKTISPDPEGKVK